MAQHQDWSVTIAVACVHAHTSAPRTRLIRCLAAQERMQQAVQESVHPAIFHPMYQWKLSFPCVAMIDHVAWMFSILYLHCSSSYIFVTNH